MRLASPARMAWLCLGLLAALPARTASAQQGPADQLISDFVLCSGGIAITIDADLRGSIRSVIEGSRTQGRAMVTIQSFLEKFPEKDRMRVYEIYIGCVRHIYGAPAGAPQLFLDRRNLRSARVEMLNQAEEYVFRLPQNTSVENRMARQARSCLRGLQSQADQGYINMWCRSGGYPDELARLFLRIHELNKQH
jgi:hypothetical protein